MGANASRVDAQDPEASGGFVVPAAPSQEHPLVARLYVFDIDNNKWLQQNSEAIPEFSKVDEDEDDMEAGWYLAVSGQFDLLISEDLRLTVDGLTKTWYFYAGTSRCLKFYSKEGFDLANQRYDNCLFENRYKLEPTEENKKKIYEKDAYDAWALGQDPAEIFFDVDEPEDHCDPKKFNHLREDHASHEDDSEAHQLEMGGLDNSFLIKDGSVEVFRNVNDGVKKSGVSVKLNFKGTPMTPQKALLANQESNLLFLTPDTSKKSSIFRVDLEREQVVSEWTFRKDGVDIPMADIATDSKSAQMDLTSTFMGLDSNRLCRWDTRTAQGKVQEQEVELEYSTGKDYSVASKTLFRCMATTGEGHVALGSYDGRIRLYTDRSLTKAKTAFPGLGSPITAIDCSYDGKWVLATTDTYVLVISTAFRTKDGAMTTGFKAAMGKSQSAPRLLKLLPSDVTKTGNAPFTKARFTWITEQGKQERWIVVSCGTYSVLWNFRQVKMSTGPGASAATTGGFKTCFDYSMSSSKSETVMDSAFMHDNFNSTTSNMVVATKHDIYSCAGMDIDD
uniref:Vacuolar import/degradation Vid27 C-terminal domain-containing protein n=1 Tax=Pyramimonas obovata TaxID=1411642 RepID=A0A7S0QWD8_9CHLO|mmetsp:Transcript_17909/g.39101  ORF Transcript_17909/g.39101 Transcript_17909/m.39101 type:complete len:562 (+) Transcript_17909:273-1958(+)|eukprot:CAMPEP_0118950804 /NCGR_PEP_ID=MMETSP1169-20130426/52034_1 /TAXON_ID=36882 /ORGANISM="Pyramimonas obovata, Strain CCMP722" /LENGTH=561 /DNA_ID=CAMNT_0006897721 /DNA_START=189 /DNA_END=1874 /DNA_ORIENTATION=+